MAYRNFNFTELEQKFGLSRVKKTLFTSPITLCQPTSLLSETLERTKKVRLTTEKAVSEAVVFPILTELKFLNQDKVELFSGENIVADRNNGLTGECDFVFVKDPSAIELTSPIIAITEAKRGDVNNPRSLAQAAAQLLGAKIFNQKHHTPVEILYGACTTGYEWLFLKLENNTIIIDENRYFISDLPLLLGVLQHIINEQTA
ncbi:MAG: hypothetical protein JNL70_16420 [Saprospiraceae bacterium]|nr:hypothetical protein [Saprospiraceae bacterium]